MSAVTYPQHTIHAWGHGYRAVEVVTADGRSWVAIQQQRTGTFARVVVTLPDLTAAERWLAAEVGPRE